MDGLKRKFGKGLLIGFGRIGGRTVGILASQPLIAETRKVLCRTLGYFAADQAGKKTKCEPEFFS
jgi:acetyl-CoA carboxylase carboxyltransferase component